MQDSAALTMELLPTPPRFESVSTKVQFKSTPNHLVSFHLVSICRVHASKRIHFTLLQYTTCNSMGYRRASGRLWSERLGSLTEFPFSCLHRQFHRKKRTLCLSDKMNSIVVIIIFYTGRVPLCHCSSDYFSLRNSCNIS